MHVDFTLFSIFLVVVLDVEKLGRFFGAFSVAEGLSILFDGLPGLSSVGDHGFPGEDLEKRFCNFFAFSGRIAFTIFIILIIIVLVIAV